MSTLTTRALHISALSGAAIAVSAVAAQPAYAATSTSTLSVDATVTANCNVSTTAVNFNNVNVLSASNHDATGGLSVTCNSGTVWSASANAGSGSGATLSERKMTSGTNTLNYALYTDSARSTVWGDAADVSTVKFSGTGTGSAQASTIYARVPSGQTTVPAGSYADTVTVTVTY